jgi:hypothetical protein
LTARDEQADARQQAAAQEVTPIQACGYVAEVLVGREALGCGLRLFVVVLTGMHAVTHRFRPAVPCNR